MQIPGPLRAIPARCKNMTFFVANFDCGRSVRLKSEGSASGAVLVHQNELLSPYLTRRRCLRLCMIRAASSEAAGSMRFHTNSDGLRYFARNASGFSLALTDAARAKPLIEWMGGAVPITARKREWLGRGD